MNRLIYLDNAATTRTLPEVVEEMIPWFCDNYGNASSIYLLGQKSRFAVERSRRAISIALNCSQNEIFFTSGGSESDNWAIKGAAQLYRSGNIITSRIEHHAVLKTCEYLQANGFTVTYLDADSQGIVSPLKVENAIRPDTFLVSVMTANNEIGTIEPVNEIARVISSYNDHNDDGHRILFHTDAVQAFGHIPINVKLTGVDMMSASAHKLGGPKGIGMLYVRRPFYLPPLINGGGQEAGHRAGTENIPAIIGFAKAVDIAVRDMEKTAISEKMLRDHLIMRVLSEIPSCRLTGNWLERLPNHASFIFDDIDGESLLTLLDMNGICASSGSACSSGSSDPSHVLLAIGKTHKQARSSLRLTLGQETTLEDVDYAVNILKKCVSKLRSLSPTAH